MIRRLIATFLLCVALSFCLSASADAQTRIGFRRGATHAVTSGTLNSLDTVRLYVIRVRDGQTFRAEQIGGGSRRWISIVISDPNGNLVGDAEASCHNRREISPTVAGDYTIRVVECPKGDPWRGRFTFRVTVR